METATHLGLKRAALQFLRQRGFVACASEVRCPIPRWTADVAGWTDRVRGPSPAETCHRVAMQTVIIECKQSRGDFLRDSRRLNALLQLRLRLDGIRRSIEEHRIKACEPHLRREGSSLFDELSEWNFAASRLPSYRRTLQRLERIDQYLHGGTKFARLVRYAQADALYLAAPAGLIRAAEVPPGWGLLECHGPLQDAARLATLRVRIEARPLAPPPRHRERLLRNIAAALSARDGDLLPPLPLFSLSSLK